MTRWLQAAKAALPPSDKTDTTDETHAMRVHGAVEQPQSEVLSVESVLSVGPKSDCPAIPEPQPAQPEPRPAPRLAVVPARPTHDPETFPNGVCRFTGRPRTWTGKVVSLEDWRRLSDWEREGPAGRLFCGICRAWVAQDGRCREPGCWNGCDAG